LSGTPRSLEPAARAVPGPATVELRAVGTGPRQIVRLPGLSRLGQGNLARAAGCLARNLLSDYGHRVHSHPGHQYPRLARRPHGAAADASRFALAPEAARADDAPLCRTLRKVPAHALPGAKALLARRR